MKSLAISILGGIFGAVATNALMGRMKRTHAEIALVVLALLLFLVFYFSNAALP